MKIVDVLLHIWAAVALLLFGMSMGAKFEADAGTLSQIRYRAIFLVAVFWWAFALLDIVRAIWQRWGEPVAIWLKAEF